MGAHILKLNCLEPLTAICIGVGACALAPLDAGLTAGAVIGGVGLFARLRESLRKAGLDDEAVIARTQKAVLRDWDHWQDTQDKRDAVTLADAAMTRLLPAVMMTREELAATATRSGKERYPIFAAREIVDQLGQEDAMFRAPVDPDTPGPLERRFALEVIERALRVAKEDKDYAILLTLDIAIELGRAMAEMRDHLHRLQQVIDQTSINVRQVLAAMGSVQQLEQIKGAVAVAVAENPQASSDDIVSQVVWLIRSRADALAAVADLPRATDNRDRSLQVAVEQAMAANDDDAALAAIAEAEAAIDERQADDAKKRASLAASSAVLLLGRRDWRSAEAAWRRAEAMLAPFDLFASETIAWDAVERLLEFSEMFGVRESLDAVIGHATRLHRQTELRHDRSAWAGWSIWLGIALRTQGQRTGDGGLTLLAKAVAAYRAALTVYTKTEMPADWAMTKNNLGTALGTQGQRTADEAGLALLADAVAAFRAALTVYTKAEMPADWAMTKNNLGNALSTQGQRTGGEAGLALLADAVAAYRAALTVRTKTAMPADWAMTMENLALSYEAIADRRDDPLPDLRAAEAALLAALTVYTPEHMPYYHDQAIASLARIRAKIAAAAR